VSGGSAGGSGRARVWFVTGAAGGFGALLCRRVLAGGDALVAADRPGPALDALAGLAGGADGDGDGPAGTAGRLLVLALDVGDDASVAAAAAEALERFGRVDVLVNNAGLGLGGPFEHVDMADVRRLFAVNAVGVLAVTRALLPAMRARGRGRIVMVSSDSGKVGFPFQNVYGATKHAVEGFAESLAVEVAPFGLDVAVVEPCGMFKTAMPRDAVAAARARVPPDSPYAAMVATLADAMSAEWEHAGDPALVADALYEVGSGEHPPFRTRVGPPDRTRLAVLRHELGDEEFLRFLRSVTLGGAAAVPGPGRVDGGQLVVRTLAGAGVRYMFGIVGGHNFEIVNACLDHGIRFVDTRHEQQAAHLADGVARFGGQLAAVTVDGAPGLVNAYPGLQVAYESGTPLLCVSAQGSLAGRDVGVMQAIDQLATVAPVTKWRRTCFEQRRLAEYTASALRHATTGRPGPVFLDFPLEHLRATVDGDEVAAPTGWRVGSGGPYPDPAAVAEVYDLLRAAQRPLLVVGSGAWWSGAGPALRRLVDATGIPVLTRNAARGLVPEDHPSAVGFYPTPAALADAFCVVGTRLDWTIGNGQFPLFDTRARVAQVDVYAETIGKNRHIDVGVVADARAFLTELGDLVEQRPWRVDPAWPATARGAVAQLRAELRAGVADRPADAPIHSVQLVDELAGWLPRDSVTVVDGGYIAAFALQLLDAYTPGGVTWVGSTGHLGVGVAYAMAARLARPDTTVVALCGDGSYGLSGLELDTAVRHDLPIVVVVANDAGWGEIRDGQRRRFGAARLVGSQLGATAYHEVAAALGGHGELVTRIDQLRPALDRARASGKAAVVNVLTDPDQRSTAVAALPWRYE
jgi:thiamine pyrophosphate-dependent acetolactate synthase large subunit-like protein/NAD(P)-dependent dehydrogenase (short-subunit alcohol dehydrogenase family)